MKKFNLFGLLLISSLSPYLANATVSCLTTQISDTAILFHIFRKIKEKKDDNSSKETKEIPVITNFIDPITLKDIKKAFLSKINKNKTIDKEITEEIIKNINRNNADNPSMKNIHIAIIREFCEFIQKKLMENKKLNESNLDNEISHLTTKNIKPEGNSKKESNSSDYSLNKSKKLEHNSEQSSSLMPYNIQIRISKNTKTPEFSFFKFKFKLPKLLNFPFQITKFSFFSNLWKLNNSQSTPSASASNGKKWSLLCCCLSWCGGSCQEPN
jgi:hypothetical protein